MADKPKWTEGPWTAVSPRGRPHGPLIDIVGPSGALIASISESTVPIEEDDPNIYLMAAAPDLYEALELILPDAEEFWKRTLSGSPSAIEKARMALEKANPQRKPDAQ